jgi:hypothetical protein
LLRATAGEVVARMLTHADVSESRNLLALLINTSREKEQVIRICPSSARFLPVDSRRQYFRWWDFTAYRFGQVTG